MNLPNPPTLALLREDPTVFAIQAEEWLRNMRHANQELDKAAPYELVVKLAKAISLSTPIAGDTLILHITARNAVVAGGGGGGNGQCSPVGAIGSRGKQIP